MTAVAEARLPCALNTVVATAIPNTGRPTKGPAGERPVRGADGVYTGEQVRRDA
jgi:hypothetical protein